MGNCIVVVQFDLPKRTEEQAIKGGTSSRARSIATSARRA